MLFTPIKPMLLGMRHEAFDDDRYIFEPKWDGWRILLHKEGDRVEAYTRHGNRVTDKFPELQAAGAAIRARTALLDCEGICLRDGRSIFDDFAARGLLTDPRKIAVAAQRNPCTFVAFDVLATDRDHTGEPLTDRKARLQELIDPRAEIMPSLAVEGQGKALFETTRAREMEGIVAKRKDSRYQLDIRSDNWLKIKHWKQTDAVILGYRTEPQVEAAGRRLWRRRKDRGSGHHRVRHDAGREACFPSDRQADPHDDQQGRPVDRAAAVLPGSVPGADGEGDYEDSDV